MLTGPNGERRPISPAAAAVSVVEEMARKHGHVPDGGQPAASERVSPSPAETVKDAERLSA